MSNTSEKVFSGMLWKFMERISAQLVSFTVSIVLARILMPEHYGIVAMVTVFINIANVFVTSGLSTALIQKKDADETDFSTVFWCTLALSIIIYIVLYLAAPLIAKYYKTDELIPVLRVFSLKIIISSYSSIQHAYVSRHMIFKKFFFSTLIGTIISGVVGIAMAFMGCGVWSLVAQYLVNSIIDTVILGFTVSWHPQFIFSWKAAKPLISFGWKVLAADLIGTIYNNFRQLLIGHYYSSTDLAFYNKGKQIPELISNNIDTTVSSVLFPAMSNAEGNVEKVKTMTRRSIKTTSYIIFPLMAGLSAVASPLINVLLTDKWADAVIYLQLICIARSINTVSTANLQAMRALGRSDVVLKLEFVKKPVGVLMVLVAIHYGVFWVAFTMPLYSVYATLINMLPNKKLMDYSIKEQLRDILLSAIISTVMAIIVVQLSQLGFSDIFTLIIQVVSGVLIYIGASELLKIEEYLYLKEFMRNKFIKKKR